jgi:hypothetical protein
VAGSLRRSLGQNRALVAICAFTVVLGLVNVARYPPGLGYDAVAHMSYADALVPGGHLPHGANTEYYTPPGYYAVAGFADWIARGIGASVYGSHRAGMAINVLFLLATVVFTYLIARELWPERRRIAIGAAAFVAFLPVTVKTEAMFHPETMSLALATLALWLCIRTFRDPRYAIPLGLALGVGQLVRAAFLWAVAVVLISLVAGRRWRVLAPALVLAALIPLPWYVHQYDTYGGDPVFPRPPTPLARTTGLESGKPKPLWDRQPWQFYVDPGVPKVVTAPYAPSFGSSSSGLAIPITYSELWGDYEGVWDWHGEELKRPNNVYYATEPSGYAKAKLRAQFFVGLLPTLLAVAGWLALLRSSIRRPPRLAVALLPLLGLLGYLYVTVSYPTYGGDVLKATYMLTTTGGWAIGFGYALDRLRGRAWTIALVALGLCVLAELPFLVYT